MIIFPKKLFQVFHMLDVTLYCHIHFNVHPKVIKYQGPYSQKDLAKA